MGAQGEGDPLMHLSFDWLGVSVSGRVYMDADTDQLRAEITLLEPAVPFGDIEAAWIADEEMSLGHGDSVRYTCREKGRLPAWFKALLLSRERETFEEGLLDLYAQHKLWDDGR